MIPKTSPHDTASALDARAVTPSTETLNPVPRALYVGGAGVLVVEAPGPDPVTLTVAGPGVLPVRPVRILPATTAPGVVALY